MIAPRVSFDPRKTIKAIRAIPRTVARATASELNRQRTRSRSLMVRDLSQTLGVKPQKRIRRRILLPAQGRATARRWVALGLSLFETMPARYFAKGRRGRGGGFDLVLAGGSSLRETRATKGRPFWAQMPKSGYTGVFRRVDPPDTRRKQTGGPRTWLPIQEVMVDTLAPGYRARAKALAQLAREWPGQITKRLAKDLKRAFSGRVSFRA